MRWMILPGKDIRERVLEPLLPDLVPATRGIDQCRRHQVHREHERSPRAERGEATQASARVKIVEVDIVGAHNGHDRFQMRRMLERAFNDVMPPYDMPNI